MKINFLLYLFLVISLFSCTKSFLWEGDYAISVMSFNIRYDTEEDGENKWENRKEACLEMLKEKEPTIFGIQEGLLSQVSFLEEELQDYDYVGVGRDDGQTGGEYAAIYYRKERFEVVESGHFWLSETPDVPSLGWDANNIRIVTWVHLNDLDYDTTVYVFNTHFDHKGKEAREESAKLLMEKIQEITHEEAPAFITGDFNALIHKDMFDPILNEFHNARKRAGHTDNKKSFNAFGRWYLKRNIDFIFYKNVEALAFKTIVEDYEVAYISDHYPLLAYFKY